MASIPTRHHVPPLPHARARRYVTLLAAACSTAALAFLTMQPPGTAACRSVGQATRSADLQVTAFPGVDLGAIYAGVPGVTASSGPYPGVATSLGHGRREESVWVEGRPQRTAAVDRPLLVSGTWAHGGLVLERGLARRLGLHTGARARVSTTRGDVTLPVDGVALTASPRRPGAGGVAYVARSALHAISPRAQVHGTTMMLQLDADANSGVAATVAGRYPGGAIQVGRPTGDGCLEAVH